MGTTYYTATKSGDWNNSSIWDTEPPTTLSLYQCVNIQDGATVTIPSGMTVTLDNALIQVIFGTIIVEGTLNVNMSSNTWQMSAIMCGFTGPGNIKVENGGTINITSIGNPPLATWGTVIAIAMTKSSFINYGTVNISATSNGSSGIGIQYDSNDPFQNYGTIKTTYQNEPSKNFTPSTAIKIRSGTLNNNSTGLIQIGDQESIGGFLEVDSGAKLNNQGSINNFGKISNQGSIENSNDITFNFPNASYDGGQITGTNTSMLLAGTVSGDEATLLSTVSNNYEIQDSFTINSGSALVIENGQTVTNSGTLTNNGTIIVEPGGTFTGGSGQVIHKPVITSFLPTTVVPKMWLKIVGTGFLQGGKVIFKGGKEVVFDSRSTATTAYVKVPDGATTGTLTVECFDIASSPSGATLTIATPPLITPLPTPVFPPSTSGLMSEMVEDVAGAQSESSSDSNSQNIHVVAPANSKDDSTFTGFVGLDETRKTLAFNLNSPGHMQSHGGNWTQGGSISSNKAASINGISSAPQQTADTDSTTRLVAVGSISSTSGGSSGFNNVSTNPIVLSIDAGQNWNNVSSLAQDSASIQSVTSYIGVARYFDQSNDKIIAIGKGSTSSESGIFSSKSNDGGANWEKGVKFTTSSDVVSKITSCNGKVYLIKQTSAGTQINVPVNNPKVKASTECYSSSPNSDFSLLGNLIAPQVPFSGNQTSFVLTGAASSSNRIICFYLETTQIESNMTYGYWLSETTLNANGSIGTNYLVKIPTSGPGSQNFSSLNGVHATITVSFNPTVSKFLAVSSNGAIWSRDDLNQQSGPTPQPNTSTGWQLVKSSGTNPIFNKSSTAHDLLVTSDKRSFFITGIDIVALTLTY